MPPSRRRPPATPPPGRRPRVAGLRQPEPGKPVEPPVDDAPTTIIPAVPAKPETTGAPASTGYATTTPAAKESLAARRASRAQTRATITEPEADTPAADAVPEKGPAAGPVDSNEGVPPWFRSIGGNVRGANQSTKVLVLGIIAVVLAGFAVFAGFQWSATVNDANTVNTAYIDTPTTSQVKGEVIDAIQKAFSYTYANPEQTQQDAKSVLTGSALCQYNALFKNVLAEAPAQKISFTSSIDQPNSGVEQIQGNQARLLLLINQESTRGSDGQKVTSQAVLEVGAVQQGSTWKVDNLSTFGTGQNPSTCK